MINNQKNAFGVPLRKHLVIGATTVVAAGALLGVGVAGASAAAAGPTPVPTHSSSTVHAPSRIVSLIEQLRTDLFQGQINGSKAQALASRIIGNSALFSALPVNLQNDLTTLKNAPSTDAAAQAEQIRSTALAGGYGTQVKELATDLQSSAKVPFSKSLIAKIRRDLTSNASLNTVGENIANSVSKNPSLLGKLPANLQSDVTALTNSASPEDTLRLLATERAAVADSVGPQLQTLTHMVPLTGNN
jgi:hypothetical protein